MKCWSRWSGSLEHRGAADTTPGFFGSLWLGLVAYGGGVCGVHWVWSLTGEQLPSMLPQPSISIRAGSEVMAWQHLWVPSSSSGTLPLVLHLVCELNAGCHALHGKTCHLVNGTDEELQSNQCSTPMYSSVGSMKPLQPFACYKFLNASPGI